MAVDESFNALLFLAAFAELPAAAAVRRQRSYRRPVGGSRSARAEVHYGDMTWKFTNGLNTYSFTLSHGRRIESRAGNSQRIPRERDDYLPAEIAPSFPLSMPILGGMQDDFRVVGAEAEAGGVRLSLAYVGDPSFTGTAFVGTEYGVVTEFSTPAQSLSVRDLGRLPG